MGKYVLVTGGELFNKGAQAMTFTTASEIAKRYPDKKIILMSSRDYQRAEEEKEQYKFAIIACPNLKTQLLSPILKMFSKTRKGVNGEFLRIIRQTDAIIDISGYALGSNWGSDKAISYIMRIVAGYINGIPVYLMPQSFGPFMFTGKKGKLADYLIKSFLPKARAVMVREDDGLEWIRKKYPKVHAVKTYDLVLQNKQIDLDLVFAIPPKVKKLEIPMGSVALIPNHKTITYGGKEKTYSDYRRFIDCLLDNGKTVFLIYHAVEDHEICKDLKAMYFADNTNVVVVNEELSCLDFDENVKKFDFIIGSRFHSIVHAYKNSVPAIVLGWAVKYKELMGIFDQEKYLFDAQKSNSVENIQTTVSNMCQLYSQESCKIGEILKTVQQENVYDEVKL